MAMTQEEKNAAEVRRAALALQQAQQPEKDWEQVEAFYKDKGGPPVRKRVGRYFDSAGERSSIGIAEKNLAAAKRKISRSTLAKQLNEYQHAVASGESLPSRPVQKERPAGRTIREVNAQPGLSREFTPEEMTAGGGPSPVLPEDERFSALPGGGVANSKGDYMSGTRPDGTAWNPDATTMRRLNRSPKERTADEQARVNRVNQNRQMQGDAQRIASGLDRSTQAMQLYRAAEMARIKPTPTNIARHRTLAVGMEQARQTRAEQQIAEQEARAAGVQQQFDNRMTVENLRVSRQNAASNSIRANAAGKSKGKSSTADKMRGSMIEALSYRDKDPEGTKQRAYEVQQRFYARNSDYDYMSDTQQKTAVSAFTLGEQVSAAAQKATAGWFNPFGWFDGDPLRPESGAVNKDNLNTIKKAWSKNKNTVLNLKNYAKGAMTIGEFKEGLDELPGGRNAFMEVLNNLHALGSMAKSQEIINRTALGRDLQ